MNRKLVMAMVAAFAWTGMAYGAGKACKFSDEAKLKDHLKTHVTYPATGQEIRDACKKEMPDEFSKEEHACVDGKIKPDAKFKSADEVLKVIGVK